jgi:hypothetical protein
MRLWAQTDTGEQRQGQPLGRQARPQLVGTDGQRASEQWHGHGTLQQARRGRATRPPARPQPRIQRFGPGYLLTAGAHAHRLVTDHLAVLQDRRDVGTDPVEIAVLAAVLDDTHPALAGLEVRHISSNTASGMSGWRTRLCGLPISSAWL